MVVVSGDTTVDTRVVVISGIISMAVISGDTSILVISGTTSVVVITSVVVTSGSFPVVVISTSVFVRLGTTLVKSVVGSKMESVVGFKVESVEEANIESVFAIIMESTVESVTLVYEVPSLVDILGNPLVVEEKVKLFVDVKIEPVDK